MNKEFFLYLNYRNVFNEEIIEFFFKLVFFFNTVDQVNEYNNRRYIGDDGSFYYLHDFWTNIFDGVFSVWQKKKIAT